MKVDFRDVTAAARDAGEVLLIRHGTFDIPAPGELVDGRSDPALNERGERQAQAVARSLANHRLSAIFVTPLRRTVQTAEPLVADHDLPPVTLPDLAEVFLGEWEGHGFHDRALRGDPEFDQVVRAQRWDIIPGAEDHHAFAARVQKGLSVAADAAARGAGAVVITHAAVIAEACRQVTASEPFAFLLNSNGGITRLGLLPERRLRLLSFNETGHLDQTSFASGKGALDSSKLA